MKSNIMIYICLLICIVSATTLLNEERELQQQLSSHLILKKTCTTGNCKPGKTPTFKMMVDFELFNNMKKEVLKPFMTRYFQSFSLKEKLYQQPEAQCLQGKTVVQKQQEECKDASEVWENKWDDKDTTFRKKVSNLDLQKFEIDWNNFIVRPKAGKENQIEFNFKLTQFEATVDITSEERMSGLLNKMKQSIWGGVPWAPAEVKKGKVVIDDLNINLVIQLKPNLQDEATCFQLNFNNLEISWKDIHLTNLLGGGAVEWIANFAAGFKWTLTKSINYIARPIINYKLRSIVRSFEEFDVKLATQNSKMNFQCATQATNGPKITQQADKNYFEFGLNMEFKQIEQTKQKKDDEALKKLQQRLMKTKQTCENKIPSFKFDFNLNFIEDFKTSVLKPYVLEQFTEQTFKIPELYNDKKGTVLKDFIINKLTIDWDKFHIRPLVEQDGSKSSSVLDVQYNLKDFEGQLNYEKPGMIYSKWEGNAAFGIENFVVNMQIEMAKSSTNKNCMKLSVKDIKFTWSKLLFNPFDSDFLNWFADTGANLMGAPVKANFLYYFKPKAQKHLDEMMHIENTKLFELKTPDNGDLSIELTWAATEAPALVLTPAGESDLHTAFQLDFKDVTNYPYIDGKIKCWKTYEKCCDPFYELLEKQVELDKYLTGIQTCTDARNKCLLSAESLNHQVDAKQQKILRLAKQYKKQVENRRRFNQKKQNKNLLKKHHNKQQLLN